MEKMLDRLKKITEGCRDDMHEPDEQDVTAVVKGNHLDNAMGGIPERNCGELTVGITRNEKTEWFNLATLIALARKANLDNDYNDDVDVCFYELRAVEVYYLKRKHIHLMMKVDEITLENMPETHIEMPKFEFQKFGRSNLKIEGFDVRSVELTPKAPDDIFALLNGAGDFPNPYSSHENQKFIREHKTHTGMSVGDIVKMKGKYYLCENEGWRIVGMKK